jgi:hypothetical protein
MMLRFAEAIQKKIRIIITKNKEAETKMNKLSNVRSKMGNTMDILL